MAPAPKAAAAGAPPSPPPAAVAKPAAPPPKPVTEKVTFAADVFFDFGQVVLKREGRAQLDDLVGNAEAVAVEVIIVIVHTDAIGGDNQRLSERRAEAVKAYLVSKGVDPHRIYAEGKGDTQPIADNLTETGRAQNRRVEIEVVGTREPPAD